MPADRPEPDRGRRPRGEPGSGSPEAGRPTRESTGAAGSVDGAASRPVAVLVGVALVLLEAFALVVVSGVAVASLVRGDAALPGAMVFFAAFCLLVAVVLAQASRALLGGRRWARSPVITWQVLLGVMAVGWLGVEATVAAAAVLLVAVAITVCLLLPPAVAFTTGIGQGSRGRGGAPTSR